MELWCHTASVETYEGNGARGPIYAEAVDVLCYIEDGNRMVLAADGNEVVSTGRLFAPLLWASVLTPESRVTFDGRVSRVIDIARFSAPSLDLLTHVEVNLR